MVDADERSGLRIAALICLGIWAMLWTVFLGMRLSAFDVPRVPGIGIILLTTLAAALIMPLLATALAAVAWYRRPNLARNRLTLAGAVAALFGQAVLFLVSRWL